MGKVHLNKKAKVIVHIFLKKIRSHLKILGFRRVILSKFHSEDPQMLGATLQNWDMVMTWHPGLVHT
jgi:hypothetical protein